MSKKYFPVYVLLLSGIFLGGCAGFKESKVDSINGRNTEYVISRKNAPVVVFENGLGAAFDWWKRVFPAVSESNTAVLYNRPGYGKSNVATTPRNGKYIIEELRIFLRSMRLDPPYVLVGHSLGGLYMQYYARKYPDEVSALILVDTTHPEQMKGGGAPEKWPLWVRVVLNIAMSRVAKEEFNEVNATGDQVLALPVPDQVPVWILSAKKEQEKNADSDYIKDVQAKRLDIVRLYPHARLLQVDSGHGIPLEKPEAVISAIREAVK